MTSEPSRDPGVVQTPKNFLPSRHSDHKRDGGKPAEDGRGLPSAVRDLATLWILTAVPLVALEYPLRSSLLVASIIALQASLGLQVVTRLFDVAAPSLVWLGGPGLIVGGALSYCIFQLTGRGLLGLGASCAAGCLAAFFACRDRRCSTSESISSPTVSSLFGIAVVGMSSQFEWLLPVAALTLILVFVLDARLHIGGFGLILIVLGTVVAIVLALLLRSDSWWLISDDYKFFETLSGHLASAGPTAEWGSISFLRYHWLSYGWSGLLDFAALQPETLTTLTRVMPLVYSLSFAASLLATVQTLLGTSRLTAMTVLPAWAVSATYPLDWTGTSTAASYAVLASGAAVFAAVVRFTPDFLRRLSAYTLLGAITVVTKFPSVFALLPLMICAEFLCLGKQRLRRVRALSTVVAVSLTGAFTVAILPSLSSLIGGFSIEWGEQRGDDLSRRGLLTTLLTLVGREVWILAAAALGFFLLSRRKETGHDSNPAMLALCMAPLVLVGATMDALVVGVANTNEYFSGPAHFLAGLSILAFSQLVTGTQRVSFQNPEVARWLGAATSAIVIAVLIKSLALPKLGVLKFTQDTFSDPRLIFCLICLAAFILGSSTLSRMNHIPFSILLAMCTFVGAQPIAWRLLATGVNPELSSVQMARLLGPPDAQTIGIWLRQNSDDDDLIATNYLRDREGEFSADYSLAMWSEREFLVLGPRLIFDSPTIQPSISASEDFAATASPESAQYLSERGVDWFVVDLDTTSLRSWEPFADVAVMTWRFWVLRLR